MGVQIKSIVLNVEADHAGVAPAVLIALGALALTIVVRAAYIAPLLGVLARRSRNSERLRDRLTDMQERLRSGEDGARAVADVPRRPGRALSAHRVEQFALRITRGLADLEYFRRQPLGWREGTVVVWAGMRGAVTVAAAQTLPIDTPQRSVLVLVAFAVATLSLVLQGGTIGLLLRLITPGAVEGDAIADTERARIIAIMRETAATVPAPPATEGEPTAEHRAAAQQRYLSVIAAQRSALLDARDNGTFDADVLADALANLDASQIAIEMRGQPSS
jgi:hypothetical protein